jgi:hypothetical protein
MIRSASARDCLSIREMRRVIAIYFLARKSITNTSAITGPTIALNFSCSG